MRIAGSQRSCCSLAPVELALEKVDRQRGLVFGKGFDPVEREQILGSRHRILERAVRFVDARRRLQRQSLLGFGGSGMAVGMHFTLQCAIGAVKHRGVEMETRRQAEELEMVAGEIDHGRRKFIFGKVARPGEGACWRQTLKLSPHPHASLTFGLLNLKPSFKPSRAKSSSIPSRYGRLLGSTIPPTPLPQKVTSSVF